MLLEFGIGAAVQTVDVKDENLIDVLMSNEVEKGLVDGAAVERALMSPVGTPRLKDIVKKGKIKKNEKN